ncbi:MAG: Gfo/Idh/MocA family oxidoreductase [Planctomycetes bacterium]|nr:Gfo/Idh/MocA family oxidoreductase [Planctomycetota bacterium]
MAKKKLTVGVIGCGAIGQRRHLPEYAARDDVEIVGVCDTNYARARQAAEKFGAAEAFKRHSDLLKLRPDAVSICTPNYLHAPMTIDALKAGCHVLCEKPMAASVKEARAMIAAARRAGRQLMIGHNQRLAPAHVRGREIYRGGQLGRCLGFSTSFAHPGPEGWSMDGRKCFFFKKRQAVIGALGDLGVHKIDLVRWLLGEEVVLASAMTGTVEKTGCSVDDTAYATFTMSSGIIGQMFAGWTLKAGEANSTVLYCERGVIRLYDDPRFSVVVQKADGERMFIETGRIQTNEAGGQTVSGVIDEFVDAVRTGRRNAIPGEEGARSLAAIMACVESARTRRHVRPARI